MPRRARSTSGKAARRPEPPLEAEPLAPRSPVYWVPRPRQSVLDRVDRGLFWVKVPLTRLILLGILVTGGLIGVGLAGVLAWRLALAALARA